MKIVNIIDEAQFVNLRPTVDKMSNQSPQYNRTFRKPLPTSQKNNHPVPKINDIYPNKSTDPIRQSDLPFSAILSEQPQRLSLIPHNKKPDRLPLR